jgi:hypothetical protein
MARLEKRADRVAGTWRFLLFLSFLFYDHEGRRRTRGWCNDNVTVVVKNMDVGKSVCEWLEWRSVGGKWRWNRRGQGQNVRKHSWCGCTRMLERNNLKEFFLWGNVQNDHLERRI